VTADIANLTRLTLNGPSAALSRCKIQEFRKCTTADAVPLAGERILIGTRLFFRHSGAELPGLCAEKRSGSVRLRIEPHGAKGRNTYKIAEFIVVTNRSSMFEPSRATVASSDGPRVPALAHPLLQ
jgi:hypothetical protein